jgi:2C-methyl-D-erythritol 2,4-cyclodiphosphate synthase
MSIKIGQGIDFHRLEKDLTLWLGGIKIPSEKG